MRILLARAGSLRPKVQALGVLALALELGQHLGPRDEQPRARLLRHPLLVEQHKPEAARRIGGLRQQRYITFRSLLNPS